MRSLANPSPEFLDRSMRDLPDPLAAELQLLPDFLARVLAIPIQTEAQGDHLALAGREPGEELLEPLAEILPQRRLDR